MKGQYFSFDAIIAAVIFVLAVVALLSYWHSVKAYMDYQNDPLSRDAIRISNLLFMPRGPPSSSCDSIARLGFAISNDDRRINSSIVDCATAKAVSDPLWLKDKLGTGYNVSIQFTKLTDALRPMPPIGTPPPSEASEVVKMTRFATLVNESTGETTLAIVELSLYK